MGNAAMRCMIHGAPTVRVMRTDGKIVEYDQPILASKVMMQHADHLLVHCTPGDKRTEKKHSPAGQRRSKLTIMRSDQLLLLETEVQALEEEEGRLVKGSFKGLAMRLRNQKKHLSMLSNGARKVGDTMEGVAPLLKITPSTIPSFQMAESDSEEYSATFDESGQRIRSETSIEVDTRDSSVAVSGQP